ncbi:SusC/RagA family TonB-linked outer membrane protein [Pedobacter gandavensis]|nr:SusC/RagA family TonB-linked outer membrane protein [Pedobacter gandavensis]
MRLTTVILIATLMQVSASGFSQKKITYVKKKTTLWDLFIAIKAQTGYKVLWSDEVIKTSEAIEANFTNATIDEVMKAVLVGKPLTYVVHGEMVVIRRDKPSFRVIPGVAITAIDVRGRVLDEEGKPLVGAIVRVKDTKTVILTDNNGEFSLKNVGDKAVLVISFLGYQTREILASESSNSIKLAISNDKLNEVEIVSTGYQNIPKDRATGSFVLVDSALLNRRVGSNILNRLEGITSGVLFNRSGPAGSAPEVIIRGRSTIFANTSPLIVLDNFPYDGDINNINPNDIESVTILKDAAASSIWGVRAGNGVIVIKTKKGRNNQSLRFNVNANTTISNRPDLHYLPQMSSSDYIDLEQYLFNKGFYNSTIDDKYNVISPAVAIMLQKRKGQISGIDSATKIDALKLLDARNDVQKYFYRPAINQQYSFSLNGGSKNNMYYVSSGYDKEKQNQSINSYDRFTITANNTYLALKDKLQLSVKILLTNSNTRGAISSYGNPYTPYDQLIDENGNHLAVVGNAQGLRKQYTDTAGHGALLNWDFKPLDENRKNSINKLTDYTVSTGLKYIIVDGLSVNLNYQYQKGVSENSQLYEEGSFYTRNLINTYTQLNQTTLVPTLPIPLGGILRNSNSNYYSNYGRGQINYSLKFNDRNELNLLAGFEIKDFQLSNNTGTRYGYNSSSATHIPVDYLKNFTLYTSGFSGFIPEGAGQSYSIDRFRSLFFNGSYTFDKKYVVSGSARRDESNLFGVKTNQKGVPLWSSGFMWNISMEEFYNFNLIPNLKVRVTYGYNGNLDKSTSAYLTVSRMGGSFNQFKSPISEFVNPPNPALRWEKVKNFNAGVDFISKANLISGGIEFFIKQGVDLIGNSPIAAQTGVIVFKGNSADTKTSGIDLSLTKNSISNRHLKWTSSFLLSYNRELVTTYKVKMPNNLSIVQGNFSNPIEGYPYSALFGLKFMGLDKMGQPLGLLNGVVSKNYSAINGSKNTSELVYKGAGTPTLYGSFRNTINYKGFDLSVNIIYKFNYWFRRLDVFSGTSYGYFNSGYDLRWKKEGDEEKTYIPALTYPLDMSQTSFFQNSDVLIEKGDHIRFQDLRLGYSFSGLKTTALLRNIQVYTYINNIGIIWKATKQPIDPDYSRGANYIAPRTFSFGLTTNF